MISAQQPDVQSLYTDKDFEKLGFHDCYILGIQWNPSTYSVTFALDYILQWVPPLEGERHYRFWICRAELSFQNVDDLNIALQWAGVNLECCIDELTCAAVRKTPNGQMQSCWEINFSSPTGTITLWSTGFELRILSPPILSATQSLSSQMDRSEAGGINEKPGEKKM